MSGQSDNRTLPTICVHMCKVACVSFHSLNGNAGRAIVERGGSELTFGFTNPEYSSGRSRATLAFSSLHRSRSGDGFRSSDVGSQVEQLCQRSSSFLG